VVWNKAQAVSDGRWRTLDSRALHPWVVALSELHVDLVEELMTQRFGVAWQEFRAIAGRVAKREIDGVSPDLVAEFSRRTLAIEAVMAKTVAEAEAAKGRVLSDDELGIVHRQAWRETRQKKAHRSLAEMTSEWAERARPWVGDQPASWVASLAGRSNLPALRSDDLSDAMLTDVARAAIAARSESTSVFTQANIYADVERQLHGVLFAPGQRTQVAERAVELALGMAVKLTPPELAHVPQRFRAPDGASQFAPANTWQYSTADLLAAEARLLDAGRDSSGAVASYETVAHICEQVVQDREMPAELAEVHRFHEPWEKQASTELRAGSASAIDAYLRQGRVTGGDRDDMLAACYQAWKTDVEAGKTLLMIAQDLVTVTELNRLTRADRVAAGHVAAGGLALSDGLVGGVGDLIVTRKNERALRLSDGEWVRNRDRFVVTATHDDGAMTVRRLDGDGQVVQPSGYVADHVELGYATSVHAAQGQTVGTAHALVSTAMTREVLYVATTRARESNRLYVDVEPQPARAEMAHGRSGSSRR
jgi:hypothetical protein